MVYPSVIKSTSNIKSKGLNIIIAVQHKELSQVLFGKVVAIVSIKAFVHRERSLAIHKSNWCVDSPVNPLTGLEEGNAQLWAMYGLLGFLLSRGECSKLER